MMTDTALTAAERGDLADRMLPVAARLACIARGDGDARDVAYSLDPLDRIELIAVIVALAAMVDPDTRLEDLLGHVTWDEHGHPAAPIATGPRLTLRSLVPPHAATPSGNDALLERERRIDARGLRLAHSMGPREVAERMGVATRTASRWASIDAERVTC